MGSRAGAEAIAAARCGVAVEEWRARRASGQKWCMGCAAWRAIDDFGVDASRGDGRASLCHPCRRNHYRNTYAPKGRTSRAGVRLTSPRDGDKIQARGRVNSLAKSGKIPSPNTVPCTDCGHIGEGRRHEFDHYLGYSAERHEDVEVVCSACHHRREKARLSATNNQSIHIGRGS